MVYMFKEMCVCFFKMKNRILDCRVLHRSGKRYSWCLDTVTKPPNTLKLSQSRLLRYQITSRENSVFQVLVAPKICTLKLFVGLWKVMFYLEGRASSLQCSRKRRSSAA